MQIRDSARKHGVADADILHAFENAIRLVDYEYQGEERVLVIGADTSGGFSNSWRCRSTLRRASSTLTCSVRPSTNT